MNEKKNCLQTHEGSHGDHGFLRGVLQLAIALTLLGGLAGSGAQAVAESVVGSFSANALPVLSTPRDPQDFLRDLTIDVPPPVIALTREDAVAGELMRRTRTLSETEVMRTAQALCEEAEQLGVDPLLFLALIRIESNYNHLAISPVGAEGLMQLMPPTAEWMAEKHHFDWSARHSFDPVLNVRLGARYLVQLHKQFSRMDYALTAYNRGPRNTRIILSRYGELPDFVHDFYSGKVLERYALLRKRYGHLPLSRSNRGG